jgi:rfaE bifunctional protein kinase chain/domain
MLGPSTLGSNQCWASKTMADPLASTERLLSLIDGMENQPVLMLVDLVADRFITGTPKRISREAPVLILSHESEILTPGGGANAAANVRSLGGQPLPVGVVGDDANGRDLLRELEARDIPTAGILIRPGYRTPTKTRILGGGRHSIKQQIVRFDIEDHLELAELELAELGSRIEGYARGARVAVLSDYGYGTVDPRLTEAVRGALAPQGLILCDSRYRLGAYGGMDAATPNEEEAEALLGTAFEEDRRQVEACGRRLYEQLACRFLLITRGSRGMMLVEDGRIAHIPVHGTDQVADVTGAGDTVIGTFALALAAGATPLEAALLADYAGGLVVLKMGTATLEAAELRSAVAVQPGLGKEILWGKW